MTANHAAGYSAKQAGRSQRHGFKTSRFAEPLEIRRVAGDDLPF
jgi:hypothetical protein